MHSTRRRLCLAVLAVFGLAAVAHADAPPTIEWVRIGLPSSGKKADLSGRSRNGAWAPVVVYLKSTAGHPQNAYRLRIETTDVEEQTYQYVVPVPGMSANNEGAVMGYIVPGSDGATFRVTLETADDARVISVKDKINRESGKNEIVNEQDVLFLGAGAGLATLKAANDRIDKAVEKELDEKQKKEQKDREKNPNNNVQDEPPDQGPDALRGKRQFAFAEDVNVLPDRWYGYGAVDVVILTTGKQEYVNALASGDDASDAGRRRAALQEWVRRGGQLVMSVGSNSQAASELLRKMPVVRCEFAPAEKFKLPELGRFARRQGHVDALETQVARLKKPQVGEVRTDLFPIVTEAEAGPVVLEASYGLGRVVLLCFDLDSGEFAGWKGQEDFWKQIQLLVSPYLPVALADAGGKGGVNNWGGPPGRRNRWVQPGFGEEDRADMRTELKRTLELFEDVPTISFGWVALFMLLFIALVGPLDYILLKKVFKRLELTWVTFPLIVLAACLVAYVGAYSMKGEELRVNKVDLIEVDLHQPNQVYGHSWFTLFSPRAQSYTVGIDPSETWTGPIPEGAPGPVVTLLEGGDNTRRQASQALFEKPYLYADDATGLRYVPVPVWSTRSFTASYRAPVAKVDGKDKPPISTDDKGKPLSINNDGTGLVGQLTNNLPVTLKDVCLFYRDKWYLLGDLAPDQQIKVEEFFGKNPPNPAQEFSKFFSGNSPEVLLPGRPLTPPGWRTNDKLPSRPLFRAMKDLMFYQKTASQLSNSGLREFDQSWRLGARQQFPNEGVTRYRDEAILVARAPLLTGSASWVNDHAGTGGRLWLGKLPSDGGSPPSLSGVITQETFLRVYVPVKRER